MMTLAFGDGNAKTCDAPKFRTYCLPTSAISIGYTVTVLNDGCTKLRQSRWATIPMTELVVLMLEVILMMHAYSATVLEAFLV